MSGVNSYVVVRYGYYIGSGKDGWAGIDNPLIEVVGEYCGKRWLPDLTWVLADEDLVNEGADEYFPHAANDILRPLFGDELEVDWFINDDEKSYFALMTNHRIGDKNDKKPVTVTFEDAKRALEWDHLLLRGMEALNLTPKPPNLPGWICGSLYV